MRLPVRERVQRRADPLGCRRRAHRAVARRCRPLKSLLDPHHLEVMPNAPPIRGVAPPNVAARALLEGLTPEQSRAVEHGSGAAAAAGRSRRRKDQDADSSRGVPDRERARAAVGDPRGHVQRPRRRRAAAAARRPARRDRRARGDRRHVSLGVRPAAARARERVRPHRPLHDLRPGRHAPRDRLAAVRRRARRDPAGAGRPRPARQCRAAGRDLPCQERAADPGRIPAVRPTSRRAADRGGVARERARAAPLQRVRVRRPTRMRGDAAIRAPAPARLAAAKVAVAPGRRVPGHQPRAGDARRPARRPGREPVRVRR